MSNKGSITVVGISGIKYSFRIFPLGTNLPPYSGVYIFTKHTPLPFSPHSYEAIYIGQTDNLSTRFNNHHKAEEIVDEGTNCICILPVTNEKQRLQIEADLIANYNPPCNG